MFEILHNKKPKWEAGDNLCNALALSRVLAPSWDGEDFLHKPSTLTTVERVKDLHIPRSSLNTIKGKWTKKQVFSTQITIRVPIPIIQGGTPQNQNYLLGGVDPLSFRLPLLGECCRNPGVSVPAGVVRGCVWLQWIFSEDSCNAFGHFTVGDLQAHLPTLPWVFHSLWPEKRPDPCAPPSLFTQSHPERLFFVSLNEKSLQKETFYQCGRGETKNSRSTKRHQNWIQKLYILSSGKNVLKGILHQMESTLKVTEV